MVLMRYPSLTLDNLHTQLAIDAMKKSASQSKCSKPATTRRPKTPSALRCPVVGIGAFARRLEAEMSLLKHWPADTAMAFVLVQHLDPAHVCAAARISPSAAALHPAGDGGSD